MKNTIEEQKKEINKLMRENGQLKKKVEKYEKEIKRRDEVEQKNHEMYRESLDKKGELLAAKDEKIQWLESFAAAFLAVAFGEAREIKMSRERVLNLMTSRYPVFPWFTSRIRQGMPAC